MLIVRELTGGPLLRRAHRRRTTAPMAAQAYDTLLYTEPEVAASRASRSSWRVADAIG